MIFSILGLFKRRLLLTKFLDRTSTNKTAAFWGKKHPKHRELAHILRLPLFDLEDDFLRSVGPGVVGYPPYSIVYDDIGIYCDATRPLRSEQLILATDTMLSKTLAQAQQAMDFILGHYLSEYNHAPEPSDDHPLRSLSKPETVLIIDQTFGDITIQYGSVDASTFKLTFRTTLDENPQVDIWVKIRPGALCGRKQGYLIRLAQQHRVHLLAEDINPISLLQDVDKVYCVTSQVGFEALSCSKPLTTFGLPWYARQGVSDDRHPEVNHLVQTQRRATRSLLQLSAAACLQYSRYLNPDAGETGSLLGVIDYLATVKRKNDKLHGELYCVGMSLWKRTVAKPSLSVPSCHLKFISSTQKLAGVKLSDDARILTWGNDKEAIVHFAGQRRIPLLRMEDDFIRSVGLGSNLVPPSSPVTDDIGICFNTETPSHPKHILRDQNFGDQNFQTALKLQKMLTGNHISKYNVGSSDFTAPSTDKTVVLILCQAKDDTSIRYGSPQIYRNLDLLRIVRGRNPNTYIIYKLHLDIVSGNRVGHISPKDTARYADQTAKQADILTCLQHTDEVHIMTSPTGFEALLRGKKVSCCDLPFYAGWGLTQDPLPVPHRSHRFEPWQLIAGTLIHYPDYIHSGTHQAINAETTAQILIRWKNMQENNNGLHREYFAKKLGRARQLYRPFK